MLRARLEEGLAAAGRDPLVARRAPHADAARDFAGARGIRRHQALAEEKVLAPSGNFYALEASRRLGLGDAGGLRVGLAPYTDADDVDRLLDGLGAARASAPSTDGRMRESPARRMSPPHLAR